MRSETGYLAKLDQPNVAGISDKEGRARREKQFSSQRVDGMNMYKCILVSTTSVGMDKAGFNSGEAGIEGSRQKYIHRSSTD